MSKKKEEEAKQAAMQQQIARIRMPRGREVLGILEERLGASRTRVRCLDGRSRICRIPGRLKKHLWVRPGNIVIVEPWEFGGDDKGDIVYKYSPTQTAYLKKKGQLDKLQEAEEF
jgi:translation initiation factor 1A